MRALLIGGPLDGTVHEIPEGHDVLTAPIPPSPGEWFRAAQADDALTLRPYPTAVYRLDDRLLPRQRGAHVVFRVWRTS